MATKDEPTAPVEPGPQGAEGERPGGLPPQDFRNAVRALLGRGRSTAGSHPPPDELQDYRRRRLAVRPADELREHLSVCRRCCRLLLALAGLPDVRPAAPLGRRGRSE